MRPLALLLCCLAASAAPAEPEGYRFAVATIDALELVERSEEDYGRNSYPPAADAAANATLEKAAAGLRPFQKSARPKVAAAARASVDLLEGVVRLRRPLEKEASGGKTSEELWAAFPKTVAAATSGMLGSKGRYDFTAEQRRALSARLEELKGRRKGGKAQGAAARLEAFLNDKRIKGSDE